MKSIEQQPQSTKSHLTELFSWNSEPEQALCADSAILQPILNRDANTIGRHMNVAAVAADPKAWASASDETAHDSKHAVFSEDQTRKTFMVTDCFVITPSREELRFLIQVEVKLAIEAAYRGEMRNMFQNLVDETICDVFVMGYCAATEGLKITFSYSWRT